MVLLEVLTRAFVWTYVHSYLVKLSSCLGEASELLKKIVDKETAGSQTSCPESSGSSGNRVFSALQRVRSMLNAYRLPVQQMTEDRGKKLRRKTSKRLSSC